MKKEVQNGIIYVSVLFLLLGFFYFLKVHVKYLETTHQIKHLSREYKSYFEYGYMTSYAMLLAVLVFFALKHLKYFTFMLVGEHNLANLLSSSIVQVFALGYSTFIEETLESLIGAPLTLTPTKNFIGYVVGRFSMVFILFLVIQYFMKK
tara:strand:+ start:49 stop:498 length:450 start_codon:yes stop_codon:yes gene_type:complete